MSDQNDGRIRFLGVGFDRLTLAAACDRVLTRPANAPFVALVTPNADHLVRIDRLRGAVEHAYRQSWMCLNDSRIVTMLARLRGISLPTAPGSDLVVAMLCDPRFDRTAPIMLAGGETAMFQALVQRAGLTNAVHFEAPMGLMSDSAAFDATIAAIEARPAQFTFIAVGSPQQELLAHALHKRGIATGIGLCCGAAIEYFAGRRRRAPHWMSRAGLEWLFRLLSEPRRLWRRYLVDSPQILRLFGREWYGTN